MPDYNLEGPRWDHLDIAWSVSGGISGQFATDIRRAFARWSDVSRLSFREVAFSDAAIKLDWKAIDGPGNTAGRTSYSYTPSAAGGALQSASVAFDSSEGWSFDGADQASSGIGFYAVALHEIGHALGLGHYDGGDAIMNTVARRGVTDLRQSDFDGIAALYGAGPDTSAPAPVERFFDTATGDHFYTPSAAEAASIRATLPSYRDEGAPWRTPAKAADTLDVYRFFDAATGAHFLTSSAAERDQVMATLASYRYEGVAFEAYQNAGAETLTLERFFNTRSHLHHYAASAAETQSILSGGAGAGWVDEGAGFVVGKPV